MNKKLIWAIIWIIIIILVIVGISSSSTPKDSDKESIKIGGAFGLSGFCAEWGEGESRAAQLALDQVNKNGGINGRQLELIIEDTHCDSKITVNAVNKLIHVDGVTAIIGPTWGDSFQGSFPVIRSAKVPSISPIAMEALEYNNEPIDYIFSTWFPQRIEVDTLQKYAVSKGIKEFVVVKDQDPFSLMISKLFEDQAKASGVTIVESKTVAIGSTDFKTTIAQMKSKNPQGIFLSFQAATMKATFLKQARELGMNQTLFSATDIQDPSLLESFAPLLEGVIYTYPQTSDRAGVFTEAYKARYNVPPQGPSAANSYDATMILAEALKQGALKGEELAQNLMKVSIPGIIAENVSFTDKHQISGGTFRVKTIKNGAFVNAE